MGSASVVTCDSCQAAISAEDLAEGLAVRVDGKPVCAMCVDLLPGRAQVQINRQRALRGLNATTYRVEVPAHPDHQRYTFTTIVNLVGHRRSVRQGGTFEAPLLPPPGAKRTEALAPVAPPAPRPLRRPLAVRALMAAGAALLAVALGVLLVPDAAPPVAAAPADETPRTRASYPADPLEAWFAASTDRSCPTPVLDEVRHELRRLRAEQLEAAQAQLESARGDTGRIQAAESALARVRLPADPAFGDLRARARSLEARLAEARDAATPKPVPGTAEPEPDPAVAVIPDEPPVQADPPESPAAAMPPGPECWLFTGDDVMGGGTVPYWRPGAELVGVRGNLERTLPPLAGGAYQVWVRVGNPNGQGSLTVQIDEIVIGRISGSASATVAWRPLRAALPLTAGAHLLSLSGRSVGWRVEGVYIAGRDQPSPETAPSSATVPWPRGETAPVVAETPTKPTTGKPAQRAPVPVPEAGPVRTVLTWKRSFAWPQGLKEEPLDGHATIPSPWPSGAGPFHRSQRPRGAKGVQALVLDLAKVDVERGGVVVLLHRARVDRKALAATIEWEAAPTLEVRPLPPRRLPDGTVTSEERLVDRRTLEAIPLAPLTFAETTEWQAFPIAFPDLARAGANLRLRLEDQSDLGADRGFLLGNVATVAQGEPATGDLGLMPAPLLSGDLLGSRDVQKRLVTLLNNVCAKRPGRRWHDLRTFDPRRFKLLVTNADNLWIGDYRKEAARILGLREPPEGIHTNLALVDGWFAEKQFKGAAPLIDPEQFSVAVIAPNGEEALMSLREPEALAKWVRATCAMLIDGEPQKGRRGGLLPVLVIGRTVQVADAAHQAAIDAAWARVREMGASTGLPLIDIRPAQIAGGKNTTKDLSARLLADGLRTLIYQISWAQQHLKP